ncbi:MAG: Hsp33 family molecular chaperone [Rickettsiaceae bacterium]|jgi:molecular chaperone Hsp33|nr:Hsp33 family molecular chaperone [Rickettsiaceae bacterium]
MQFDEHANDNLVNKLDLKGDYALPFMLDMVGVNGRLLSLTESVTEIISKHDYPEAISRLLSELLVFVSLLGSNLKSKGIVTAELKATKGIAKLLIADYNFGGAIRGYASFDLEANISDKTSFKELIEEGYLVITLDLGENFERYQGVVEITGESLSTAITEYMESSQQIKTAVKLVVAEQKINQKVKWIANGLLIQKLPESKDRKIEEDNWSKLAMYVETISDEEMALLEITPENLLHRLFHEEGVWAFDPLRIEHKCRCSRERMQTIVSSIPEEERNLMLLEKGHIEVSCQFCNHTELFT